MYVNVARITGSLICLLSAVWGEGDTSPPVSVVVPGDNLVLDGIPAIPAALAEDIGRYTEFRSATMLDWHPVKREMLIATRFADTAQIHRVAFPGGARTQLTFFKDSVSNATYQPTTGDYFIFTKGSGGDENFQKYRYDIATAQVTLLTDGKSRNTGGVWSNSGDRFVYGSTRRNGSDVDLWMMDPKDPKSDRSLVELKGGGWAALDFSPEDQRLLIGEFLSATESYLSIVDLKTGEQTLITPKGANKVSYGGGQFSRDGKGVYVTTDLDSEFQRLAYVDLATRKYTFLTSHISWDIESFNLSWDGKTIAFIANEDGVGVLHLTNTRNGKEAPAPTLPAGLTMGLAWHRNNRDLGFSFISARSAADAFSFDTQKKNLVRWTQSETGGINTENFPEPELVRWKSFDGNMISGWLTKPAARFAGKRPVIIDIHGGPEGQSRPYFVRDTAYFTNELGVAVLKPNIRGSSGYGKTFLQLDDGARRADSYKDINALFDWIVTRPDLDADRVMVMGGSYGGHMVLAVATFYPERIRAAMDMFGIASMVTFLENTAPYRRDLRRVEYGDERDPKMREFLNSIAPLNNAAKIVKPLFVLQGANDPRVPQSESEQIVKTVRANGTPVWYLLAKDEGHGFAKKSNRDFQLYCTVSFIREYLLK
jgi:dipeptidyl aminopeptidase/acylaminoacyl peptidase